MLNRRISIAPMMDWTDRHDRYFLRLIAPHVLLYTEMVTTGAILHGKKERFLQFDPLEHPVALQLGGYEPDKLALSAKIGEEFGYDEINLNAGCPSDRVQSGRFGACLMLDPPQVAECVSAMREAVRIPITVKCRIGVDERDSYAELQNFIEQVSKAGTEVFIIHARKAWLQGLSPKENREIPPLQYDVVYQIKRDFPHLTIVINGGIKTISDIEEHLPHVDGVMIGREAYSNPYFLAHIEQQFFAESDDDHALIAREKVIENFLPYIAEQIEKGVKLSNMTRHILGLYNGQKNARIWRRYLSEQGCKDGAGVSVVVDAMKGFVEG